MNRPTGKHGCRYPINLARTDKPAHHQGSAQGTPQLWVHGKVQALTKSWWNSHPRPVDVPCGLSMNISLISWKRATLFSHF